MNGYMWPINGRSKAKRLLWGDRQNHLSWAYMKMLRENCDKVTVYDVNPYIEVYHFEDNLYGLFNQNCDFAGDVWQWLVIGPEKAMLIDTAFGIGNIRGLCEELIDGKELIVVNTHAGPDHCFGNVLFDKVYCHEIEYDTIKTRLQPSSWDYLFNEKGENIWLQFDKKDLPAYKEYELIPVPNHYVFNLGEDYDVELVWMPGHSAGHCMFLDKKRRRLFAGDDVCSDIINCGNGGPKDNPISKYRTIEAYRNELAQLCERLDEFDYIFPGHFMVYLENSLMLDILDTLNSIMENPYQPSYTIESKDMNGHKRVAYHKLVRGFSTVSYNPESGVYMKDYM